jgi:ethanolamine utilization protein EutQ (cupin superfamily)
MAGEFHITDEEGTSIVAKPGDTLFFPKGVSFKLVRCSFQTTITFSSPDYGLAYYVGLRPADSA